jgi:hypothetical protein
MRTRRIRKRKTRKGGGIEFDRTKNTWVSTSKSKDRNSNHSQYSLAEATFLNRLKVTEHHGVIIRVNGREHRYPNKPALLRDHAVITEKLGEGFLLEDITKHEFDTLFLEINKTIQSLRIALEKRQEESKTHPKDDSEINKKHRESEILLRDLLGAIEVFLIPYHEQEERFKPKQLIKRKITPKPFVFEIDPERHDSPERQESEREESTEKPTIQETPESELERPAYETPIVIPNKFFVTTVVNDIIANSFALIAKGDKMILLVGGNELNIITLGNNVESYVAFDVEAPIDYLTTAMIRGELFIYIVIENTLYKIPFRNASEIGERIPMISLKISGLSYDSSQGLVCLHSNRLFKYDKSDQRMVENLPVRDLRSKNIDINHRFTVIADTGNHRIIIITNKTNTYVSFGSGMGCNDGISPKFNSPEDVCFMLDDSILVADTGNHCIRRLYQTKEGWITETIAGTPMVPGNKNGVCQVAQFHYPCKVKLQDATTFFVIDRGNTCIKKVELNSPGLERHYFLASLLVPTIHVDDLVELIHQEDPKENGLKGLVTEVGNKITVFFDTHKIEYSPVMLRVITPPLFHLYDTVKIVHTKPKHNGTICKVTAIKDRAVTIFTPVGEEITLKDIYLEPISQPTFKIYDTVCIIEPNEKKLGFIVSRKEDSYIVSISGKNVEMSPRKLLKLKPDTFHIKEYVYVKSDKKYGFVHEIIPATTTTDTIYVIKYETGFSVPTPYFALEKIDNPEKIGKRIRLVNYQGENAKFNGRQGTVKKYDSEKDIYLITFDNGKDAPINGRYTEFI